MLGCLNIKQVQISAIGEVAPVAFTRHHLRPDGES
jgi:hypothetical protein